MEDREILLKIANLSDDCMEDKIGDIDFLANVRQLLVDNGIQIKNVE